MSSVPQIASLTVSPEIMKEVDSRQNRLLVVPPRAAQKGSGEKASASWIELLEVDEVKIEQKDRKDKDGNVIGEGEVTNFELTFRIPDDSPWTENIGGRHKEWWGVNPTAMAAGNKKDGHYTMSLISIGRMKQLIRMSLCPLPDGEVDLLPYFSSPDDNEQPPVVGARFYARIVHKVEKDRDGVPTPRQSIVRFADESSLGSL